jgi:hypothetical protein
MHQICTKLMIHDPESHLKTITLAGLDGRRQPSLDGTSWMNREVHVQICGRLGVQFPGPTRPRVSVDASASLRPLCEGCLQVIRVRGI